MKPPLEITVQSARVHSGSGTCRKGEWGQDITSMEGIGLALGLGGGSPSQKAEMVLEGDGQGDSLPGIITFENKSPKSLSRP